MAGKVKPIETRYNGYRFRSRIEARWAVFFDALGVKYEYEKEGYALPSGKYLPDFWLPEEKVWIEIKGQSPSRREQVLASELFEATSYPVFLFPQLSQDAHYGWCFEISDSGGAGSFYSPSFALKTSQRDGKITLCFEAVGDRREREFYDALAINQYVNIFNESTSINEDAQTLQKAIVKAKSARFEYGEQG